MPSPAVDPDLDEADRGRIRAERATAAEKRLKAAGGDKKKKEQSALTTGLDSLLKDAPLPVKVLGGLMKPLIGQMGEMIAESQADGDELLNEAQSALRADPRVVALLGDSVPFDFRSEKIDRSLLDAAGSDAFNPSLIVDLLRPITDLKEEAGEDGTPTGKLVPMVNFNDIDEKTGEPIKTLRTPAEAVKRMKELPEQYGGLFKSNVVSGVGAGSAEGSVGKSGPVDINKLTPEQYRKLRKENPEALGLPPRRNRY